MKSVLVSAGNVKREKILQIKSNLIAQNAEADEAKISEGLNEQEVRLSFLEVLNKFANVLFVASVPTSNESIIIEVFINLPKLYLDSSDFDVSFS